MLEARSIGAMRTALALLLPALLAAQNPEAHPLAWMEGVWIGESGGVRQEEIWSAPAQGHLQGMYREMKDGKVLVMELLTLSQDAGGWWLTMRHFDGAMQPWASEKEAPLRWKAFVAAAGHARFDLPSGGSLEYWREGNFLRAELNVPGPSGKAHKERFVLRRKN